MLSKESEHILKLEKHISISISPISISPISRQYKISVKKKLMNAWSSRMWYKNMQTSCNIENSKFLWDFCQIFLCHKLFWNFKFYPNYSISRTQFFAIYAHKFHNLPVSQVKTKQKINVCVFLTFMPLDISLATYIQLI